MEFKSFYGSSIREALDAARRELGADAAILASRQLDPEPGKPRQFEAVCGVVSGQDRNRFGTIEKGLTYRSLRL